MSRFFQWLRALWVCVRFLPAPPTPAPTWTRTDADQWAAFLGSATGQKLSTMLLMTEQTQDRAAIAQGPNAGKAAFACGIAFGWRGHNAWLWSLKTFSASSVPSNGPTEQARSEGAAELFERLAP